MGVTYATSGQAAPTCPLPADLPATMLQKGAHRGGLGGLLCGRKQQPDGSRSAFAGR